MMKRSNSIALKYRSLLKLAVEVDRRGMVSFSLFDWLKAYRNTEDYTSLEKLLTTRSTNLLDASHEILNSLLMHPDTSSHCAHLEALYANFGNKSYKDLICRNIFTEAEFLDETVRRSESNRSNLETKQNFLLRRALRDYVDRLEALQNNVNHTGIYDDLTVEQLDLPERVVIDISEKTSSQVIFIISRDTPKISVESISVDSLKGARLHQETYADASRIYASLTTETNFHSSRITTLVGHGYSGGIALALGFILISNGFPIRNVISFGGTKCVESARERDISQLNVIRITIDKDSTIHLPGEKFYHVGEALVLTCSSDNSLEGYRSAMHDPSASMAYYDDSEQLE